MQDCLDSAELCKQIRHQAIRYLSYREHAPEELKLKLLKKFDAKVEIKQVLKQLIGEDWLSERRYVESYIRVRAARGYGSERIRAELFQKKVAASLIDDLIESSEIAWGHEAYNVWLKKFDGKKPADLPEKATQWRFMQYRGFRQEEIKRFLDT